MEQLRSRVARAKTSLLSYKIALNTATSNYLRVVGIKPLANLTGVTMPEYIFKTTDEIKVLTIKYNPTIQKNIDNIAKLLGDKAYAQSSNVPKFSIEVGPSYFDTNSSRDESNTSLNATLKLRWNLYSGGANTANVKISSTRIRQARQELHQVMDALNEDIETSFIQTLYASEQAKQMAIAARSSKKSRDNFYQQFLAGKKGLLDVLDAESENFSASVEQLSYKHTHIKGSYRLLSLAGILLNELGIDGENIKEGNASIDSDISTYGIKWSTLNPQPVKK